MYDLLQHKQVLLELKKLLEAHQYAEAMASLDIQIRITELTLQAERSAGGITIINERGTRDETDKKDTGDVA